MVGDRYAPAYSILPGSAPTPRLRAASHSGVVAMNISDLIGPGRVILNLRLRDKAQLLRELAHRAATIPGPR